MPPPGFIPEIPALYNEVAALALRVARPLIWHDRTLPLPKVIEGATCFFLRFERGAVGVTANHVVTAFENALTANRNIVCQIRTSPAFDLLASIIDRDGNADIATFNVSEEFLCQTEAVAIDCRGNWPPPTPDASRALSICGYPEGQRTIKGDGWLEFGAYGALAAVEDASESEILVTYDPHRDQPTTWAPVLPPLGLNMSGCSGGPVLMHGAQNGIFRCFPVGLIVSGPRNQGTGTAGQFDIIRLRRIHVIQNDGLIQRVNSGWLPS